MKKLYLIIFKCFNLEIELKVKQQTLNKNRHRIKYEQENTTKIFQSSPFMEIKKKSFHVLSCTELWLNHLLPTE